MNAWRDGAAPSSTFLLKIADYFEVSCDWLLERTEDPAMPDEMSLVLSEDERFYIDKLRTCDIATRQKIMITGLVFMGCSPDRDQLPSLRDGSQASGTKPRVTGDDEVGSVG